MRAASRGQNSTRHERDDSNSMAPQDIRFSQDSCSSVFRDHHSLENTLWQLKNNPVATLQIIPPIQVFWWPEHEAWFSEDNRRLWCFQQANLSRVPVTKVLLSEVNPTKLTTINGGVSIHVRRRV